MHRSLLALGLATLAVGTAALARGIATTTRHAHEHPRYWAEWESRALDEPLVWVALGDSASQAVGAADPTDGWIGQVAARLEREHARPVRVINIAVSGARARNVIDRQLPRLAELLAGRDVDLVTCVVGGNDVVKPGYDPARFEREMDEIADALPAGAVLGEVPYFGRIYGFHQRRAAELNDIVRAVAARHPHLVLGRMHDEWAGEWPREVFRSIAGDMFHPNERGYSYWARFLGRAVDESLRRRGAVQR